MLALGIIECQVLDERRSAILRAVVEQHIQTAEPVGSGRVASSPAVTVSPATVRNDMAVLESDGYLRQPHVSAGRVPTDKGYRWFVDHLTGPGPLSAAQTRQVRSVFDTAHGELEQMLRATSELLSQMTALAGVVVGPPHEAATLHSLHLVDLAPEVTLLVLVHTNGVVEKHTIDLSEQVDRSRTAAAETHLRQHLVGCSLGELPTVPPSGDEATDRLVAAALAACAVSEEEADVVYVGGAARMASAFEAVDTVREVLTILEQQYVVVTLLRDVLDRGLSVAIGTETGMEPLNECSVVVAPYEVDGEPAGTIGVLGPTRMDYEKALATVAVVSRRLGDRLDVG